MAKEDGKRIKLNWAESFSVYLLVMGLMFLLLNALEKAFGEPGFPFGMNLWWLNAIIFLITYWGASSLVIKLIQGRE